MSNKTNRKVQYLSGVCAAFVFTFTGATLAWSSPAIPKFINGEANITITDTETSWVVSLHSAGALFGCYFGQLLNEKVGRRRTLTGSAVPAVLGALTKMKVKGTIGTETKLETLVPKIQPRKYEIFYQNVVVFSYFHLAGIYGLYLGIMEAQWPTLAFSFVVHIFATMGITAGVHRFWSHKTYKAKLPLEILLMLMHSMSGQYSAFFWVTTHRLHHKYSDTDADPHNASRGLFFSHIGWILVRRHPEVKIKKEEIDLTDIYNNPLLRFQNRFFIPVIGLMCFGLPTFIPVYFWGESLWNAWHVNMFRYILLINMSSLVNSFAHAWGSKPYDKSILPSESSLISFITYGEGFHNFHHVFPMDYRTAELGNNYMNVTTKFIDFFAAIGWAYDLKTVSPEIIQQRAERTGDGTDFFGSKDYHF